VSRRRKLALWLAFYLAAISALGYEIYASSLVGSWAGMFDGLVAISVPAIAWVACLLLAAPKAPLRWTRPALARWAAFPILVGLTMAIALSPWPTVARFNLSRSDLDHAVARVQAGQTVSGGWVGATPVDWIALESDGTVVFAVTGCQDDVGEACGIAYNGQHTPTVDRGRLGYRLADGWWTWDSRI
jgi:hypothetical protein